MKKLDYEYYLFSVLANECKTERERTYKMGVNVIRCLKENKPRKYWCEYTINKTNIFNPLDAEYLNENPLHINTFIQGHKKGIKYFRKNFFVKAPTQEQIKIISEKYNKEWKKYISVFQGVWNDEVIKKQGFNNGILQAYSEFEENYWQEFQRCLGISEPKTLTDLIKYEKYTPETKTEKGKKDKKPTKKDDYLFVIGLKLATGELDEDLFFDKDGKRTGINMSYPKLAEKFTLDKMHLKATLSNYIDQSNKSKNLHYNPEIIEKVLTCLKSEGKEPKEWFLKEFKK